MHDVDFIGVKMGIPLTTFFKALYSIYSHHLESLQTGEKLKSIAFDTLVEKFAKQVKVLEIGRQKLSPLKKQCTLL